MGVSGKRHHWNPAPDSKVKLKGHRFSEKTESKGHDTDVLDERMNGEKCKGESSDEDGNDILDTEEICDCFSLNRA